jgi:hypothetical protein
MNLLEKGGSGGGERFGGFNSIMELIKVTEPNVREMGLGTRDHVWKGTRVIVFVYNSPLEATRKTTI